MKDPDSMTHHLRQSTEKAGHLRNQQEAGVMGRIESGTRKDRMQIVIALPEMERTSCGQDYRIFI